ncbi:MAG TPA: PAS domain-containing protein [Chitinophagaceae bacterium]|jgi:signal transduction histidine kinase|nr:PAS domain-containing protein [Chitinophagaceae bacterium]
MQLLTEDISLIVQAFDHQPEATVFVRPVRQANEATGRQEVVDFVFVYCNAAIRNLTGQQPEQVIGRTILQDRLPDPGFSESIFRQCLQVYESGTPMEFTYFSTTLEKYVSLQRVKMLDGVLTTARNRTEEYKSQLEKDKQARLLHNLIDHSPYGVSLYESVRNEQGAIEDFRLRLCNQKSADITAFPLEVLYTRTVKELIALRGHSNYFDIVRQVVETGTPQYLEYYSPVRDQWIGFSIVKFDDGYLLNYIDISKTKKLEEEARRNAHELDALFNASISGIYSARVLRNEEGGVYDLEFLRANDSFYRMFGTTGDRIIGHTLSGLSGRDDQTPFLSFIGEVIRTGQPATHVLHYAEPDRWYEFSVVRLGEETVSVTVNDITQAKRTTAEIEQQKVLLDNILRQSPNGLSITKAIRDASGQMVDAISVLMNEACERLNGVPNAVLLTHSMATLDPNMPDSPVFRSARALEKGASFRTEYHLPSNGRWLELAVARMDEEHFINVFTDITPIKEAQFQLEQMVEELRRSNESLEEFARAASHDLKEPIRKVLFFSERLKLSSGERLTEAEKVLVQKLEQAATRMGTLVDDLLAFSHASYQPIEFEEVNLNDKIKLVLLDLEFLVAEKKAEIRVGPLPTVKGNRRQLQQAFQNLLSNAIKYSRPGESPQVTVSARLLNGDQAGFPVSPEDASRPFHLIEVTDNGIGFDQQYAEKIFNLFTRLHGNKEYPGTGIGLAIVRKVVEHHRGYVRANGVKGQGATFSLLLPA